MIAPKLIQMRNFSSIKVCFERFFLMRIRIVCFTACKKKKIPKWSNALKKHEYLIWSINVPHTPDPRIRSRTRNCHWLPLWKWTTWFQFGIKFARSHKTKCCRKNDHYPYKTFHELKIERKADCVKLISDLLLFLFKQGYDSYFQSHCYRIQNRKYIPKLFSPGWCSPSPWGPAETNSFYFKN